MPAQTVSTVASFDALALAWRRSLELGNRSPKTVSLYMDGLRQLSRFLVERGMPTDPVNIAREHVETFVLHILRTRSPRTAAIRHATIRRWFRWLVEEGEITRSPAERIKAPKVTEDPPAVLSTVELERILSDCQRSNSFKDRRDLALFLVLIDTGVRRGECAGINLVDVDLDHGLIEVDGKTGKRIVGIGRRTTVALDRYLRVRARHKYASSPLLWVGRLGPLTSGGLYNVVVKRAASAGVDMHPHDGRHYFAHAWLKSGGSEGDLLSLAGWTSHEMLRRYGKAEASRRALDSHKKRSPADNL